VRSWEKFLRQREMYVCKNKLFFRKKYRIIIIK
jgi:hypothetical protein